MPPNRRPANAKGPGWYAPRPAREFGDAQDEGELDAGVTKDRIRQIGKRASKMMAELAETEARFAVMADYRGKSGKRMAA